MTDHFRGMAFTLLIAMAAGHALAQEARVRESPPRVPAIRVMGQAEVSAEPDRATFTVGARINDPSAGDAMSRAAKISDAVLAALLKAKVPKENIRTTQLTLNQMWEPVPPPEPADTRPYDPRGRRTYQAAHIFFVELGRDRFDDLGAILDAVMKAEGNEVGDVVFSIKDESDLRSRGLAQAVKNAEAKARTMAEAAGVKISHLLFLNEEGLPGIPRPMFDAAEMRASFAPTPVPPSQIERTYSVVAEYAIAR